MGIFDNFNIPGITRTGIKAPDLPSLNPKDMFSKIGTIGRTSEDDYVEVDFGDQSSEVYSGTANPSASVEELQAVKDNYVSQKTESQNELSSVNSGESEQLSGLKQAMDDAYNAYQDAMSEDEAKNPEIAGLKERQESVKTEIETNSTNILNKKSEISTKENEISEQNTCISGFKSELSTLKAQLSSIPANSSAEGSEEANAQLEAQREQIRALINLKNEEISLAEEKLSRLEDEKSSLESELENLETEKSDLENTEAEIQKEIEETVSETTKNAMEAYNSAKETFENQKASLSEKIQNEISTIQSEIEEVEAQITEARNKEYKEGNYEMKGSDVTDLATQYEGLNNDRMKEIMTSEGARFDDGVWCADFVTHMMKKVYGENGTPDDFANTCELFCSCQEIANWGEERGRTTTDSSEVKAGDAIIIRTDSGGLHIGLVVSVNEDGTINTIEGNTAGDDGVYKDNGEVNRRIRNIEDVYTFVNFQK